MSNLDVIVFMKVHNFYEFFGPHVSTIERILEMEPDGRSSEGFGLPNNGIPSTQFEKAKETLIAAGHDVRVIDMIEKDSPQSCIELN